MITRRLTPHFSGLFGRALHRVSQLQGLGYLKGSHCLHSNISETVDTIPQTLVSKLGFGRFIHFSSQKEIETGRNNDRSMNGLNEFETGRNDVRSMNGLNEFETGRNNVRPMNGLNEFETGRNNFRSMNGFREFETGRNTRSMNFVREIMQGDGRNWKGNSPLTRYTVENNADIVHVKLMKNNTFVTVTDSKGNKKIGASSGCLSEMKGGPKLSRYAAEATAEHVGRVAKNMGLKSVVMKVNGFTYFKKKKQAILSFREGYTNSKSDQNPVVYIEDTTRKPHNGCRLRKKRRV